ncbi:MAG: RluA family pseudouridine synthase [candidate division KSB1 bacterium]|nr:RluA family pseudouridine synthase [candidate division KSB1 bacterium]MDZ7303464.1 RluA family pseudouridine synthase [candidate division KSB1 bacterium]MDZ7312546.1 RluA family pseudouridine synthase [candidate division KSB1 bacterium]
MSTTTGAMSNAQIEAVPEAVRTLRIPEQQQKDRLDKYLTQFLPELTRTRIQQLINDGLITINGATTKPSHQIAPGELVEIRITSPPPSQLIIPEPIPLRVVYEDPYLIVIDKPAGMVVHPACGHPTGTLANALLYHYQNLSQVGGQFRPGIVHRLDKDTSGLLVAAHDDQTHAALSVQFKQKSSEREYLAVVWGCPKPDKGTISSFLIRSQKDRRKIVVSSSEGKWAITHYEVIEKFRTLSLLRLNLETGRTHQIRAHLSHLGCPVFGDPIYGGRKSHLPGLNKEDTRFFVNLLQRFKRQALHARVLGFVHPVTQQPLHFESELPQDMQELIEALRRHQANYRTAP